jgi:hypothetical protein
MDSDSQVLAFILIWVVLFGFVGGAIWQSKGGSFGGGFLICALLGFLGLIFVVAAKPKPAGAVPGSRVSTRECPFCKSNIRPDASVCPHCQRESPAWVFHEGRWWIKDDAGQDWWLNEGTRQWELHSPS